MSDGSLSKCTGDVKPAAKDTCGNAEDDDCDGVMDNGCAPSGVNGRFGTAVITGKGTKSTLRAFVGGSLVGGAAQSSAKKTIDLGFYARLSTVIK